MKITIDIPSQHLKELLRYTGADIRSEAIITAIIHFNRFQRLKSLKRHIGTLNRLFSREDLRKLRKIA